METQYYFVFVCPFPPPVESRLQKIFLEHSFINYHGVVVEDNEALIERIRCEVEKGNRHYKGSPSLAVSLAAEDDEKTLKGQWIDLHVYEKGDLPSSGFVCISIAPIREYLDLKTENFHSLILPKQFN